MICLDFGLAGNQTILFKFLFLFLFLYDKTYHGLLKCCPVQIKFTYRQIKKSIFKMKKKGLISDYSEKNNYNRRYCEAAKTAA